MHFNYLLLLLLAVFLNFCSCKSFAIYKLVG
jgi:hypothetical protein